MDASTYYEINTPYVISETVDAETFIVDYTTGYYFSLDAAGTWVWRFLAAGQVCLDDLYKEMGSQGAVEEGDKERLKKFFEELIQVRLIVKSPDGTCKPQRRVTARGIHNKGTDGIEWAKIKINKFTDMKMLIRLDPVHEIDGRGWPQHVDEPS